MAILHGRQETRKRAAEALTLPDFIALSSLEAEDGTYLSLEARISEASRPIALELQRLQGEDRLLYSLCWNTVEFSGTVSLSEEEGEYAAQVTLDRFNGKRVFECDTGKGDTSVMYMQGCRTERGGTPREIGAQELRIVTYWVPTIINHIASHVDYFLREIKRNTEGSGEPNPNRYGLERNRDGSQETAAVVEETEEMARSALSPSAHFRRSYERTLQLGDTTSTPSLTIGVSGTYVNTNWQAYQTPAVLASVRERAGEIFPQHFERKILPAIAAAGHSYQAVMEAYRAAIEERKLRAA